MVAGLLCLLMAGWAQDAVPAGGPWDMVVAKDGSGDFTTIQEAIDAVPHLRSKRTTIYIRAGSGPAS